MPQGAGRTAALTGADDRPRWLGLLRIVDGVVAGAPQWVEPTATGAEVGALALTEGAVSEVGPDVSARHARLWRDDAGAWWVEGCDSRHGTMLVNGLTGEETVVEPPRGQRDGWQASPVPVAPGDQLCLARLHHLPPHRRLPGVSNECDRTVLIHSAISGYSLFHLSI